MPLYSQSPWSVVAARVEAIGAIVAAAGSGWNAAVLVREAHGVRATKTAALNLAILATTQIHHLHAKALGLDLVKVKSPVNASN